ncbi:MAG: UDP-N-acetylglucosamine 2-epimerase (non-hydrolyzing) [Elusimicrobia bacterium]|nr:UDP-N-acetylglucosamine 2-epimerase (non-hydrolyzing) [Elusimicrobiota bacterium]
MGARKVRILAVWGTRPEAIKLAPVLAELKARPELRLATCVTGQHRGMLDQALRAFRIRPDYDLDVMRPGQTPQQVLSRVLEGVARVLTEVRPRLVLVQGDTTTTLAASLAASYAGIPVGHVEAGLRTHDLGRPFPEELDRVVTDRLASLHFAPTGGAKWNLLAEGIAPDGIFVTGNTVVDAVRLMGRGPRKPARRGLAALFSRGPVILATLHRRESFGPAMAAMARALRVIVRRSQVRVLLPVHPNPAVRKALEPLSGERRILLTSPLAYGDLLYAMQRCRLILSDSGGLQEEAASFQKPVLILRTVTERPEGVRLGFARLVGTDEAGIASKVCGLLRRPRELDAMARGPNPFGDGHAAPRIGRAILHRFGLGPRPRDWAT